MCQAAAVFDAYLERTCPACAGTYRITVKQNGDQVRVHREWLAGRPCASCLVDPGRPPVPAPFSDAVAVAWDMLVRASAATGLELHVGVVPLKAAPATKAG